MVECDQFHISVIPDVLHKDAIHIVVRLSVRERGPPESDPCIRLRVEQPSPRQSMELSNWFSGRAQRHLQRVPVYRDQGDYDDPRVRTVRGK